MELLTKVERYGASGEDEVPSRATLLALLANAQRQADGLMSSQGIYPRVAPHHVLLTELEREWHESRGDHDLTIESWTAREADWVRVGLDYIKCGGASASRTLRYRTDPGLPRPFSDVASVTVAETQVLQQLTTDGSWVVTSVATFEGLPKSDCLRVHTRYYFLAVPPSPAGAAGVPSPGNICAIQILRFTPVLGPHL